MAQAILDMKRLSEYNSKPWPIRLYRWLKWRPWFFVLFCYWILWWALKGAKLPEDRWQTIDRPIFPTRRSFVSHLWTISASMADHRMGNSISLGDWLKTARADCQ
jgi:hypothetical protein